MSQETEARKGHEVRLMSFYEDRSDRHIKKVSNLLDEGYDIRSYSVDVKGGSPYHSFVLVKEPPFMRDPLDMDPLEKEDTAE